MGRGISHDRDEESPEAKGRWFRSLTLQERMAFLCEVTELALTNDPTLARGQPVREIPGRVRVLELPADRRP